MPARDEHRNEREFARSTATGSDIQAGDARVATGTHDSASERDREVVADTGREPPESHEQHERHAGAGELVGEAAGGISGVVAGAALGSIAGPVGTVVGGIAGAIGGWWTGRAVAEAAGNFTDDKDAYYRAHFEAADAQLADRAYDDVRPMYQLGYLARQNPEYAEREFETIEPELRSGWTDDLRTRYGEWDSVRTYVRTGYERDPVTLQRETDAGAAELPPAGRAESGGGAGGTLGRQGDQDIEKRL